MTTGRLEPVPYTACRTTAITSLFMMRNHTRSAWDFLALRPPRHRADHSRRTAGVPHDSSRVLCDNTVVRPSSKAPPHLGTLGTWQGSTEVRINALSWPSQAQHGTCRTIVSGHPLDPRFKTRSCVLSHCRGPKYPFVHSAAWGWSRHGLRLHSIAATNAGHCPASRCRWLHIAVNRCFHLSSCTEPLMIGSTWLAPSCRQSVSLLQFANASPLR